MCSVLAVLLCRVQAKKKTTRKKMILYIFRALMSFVHVLECVAREKKSVRQRQAIGMRDCVYS